MKAALPLLLSTALLGLGAPATQAQTGDSPSRAPGAPGTTGTAGTANPTGPGMSSGTTSGSMGMGSAYAGGAGWSLLPWTQRGYVGLNVGKPDFQGDCPATFACDDASARMHLYTGGFMTEWLGAEVGYQREGTADRAGGQTRAEGINLSLVLHAPLGQFHVFGKAGALYGRTRVSADALSGITTGKETGWGSTVGLGVGFDILPNVGVVVEWARNRYRFAGDVRENIDSTNLGVVYRF